MLLAPDADLSPEDLGRSALCSEVLASSSCKSCRLRLGTSMLFAADAAGCESPLFFVEFSGASESNFCSLRSVLLLSGGVLCELLEGSMWSGLARRGLGTRRSLETARSRPRRGDSGRLYLRSTSAGGDRVRLLGLRSGSGLLRLRSDGYSLCLR